MPRWSHGLFLLAAIGACGISPISRDIQGGDHTVLGKRPSYGPATVSTVLNPAAIDSLIWVPGLDEGWNPQGLAVVEGSLLVSVYQSNRFGVNRGPCRVFRVDPGTGRETGHFDVPPPCGHAGGLAYAGGDKLYITDTHTLFEVDLKSAFANPVSAFRIFPLGPGLRGALAASGRGEIWIGTYEENQPGRILRFDRDVLEELPDRAVLSERSASAAAIIPSYAQGAAVAASGKLWVSRSEIGWGAVEELDIAGGRVGRRYPVSGGIEGISFDPDGRMWAVSEAGARHNRWVSPFFPVIFRLDIGRLESPG
jgi:hypothetical protein